MVEGVVRAYQKTPNGVSISEAEIPGTPFWVATAAGQRVGARKSCRAPGGPGNKALAGNLKVFLKAYDAMLETDRRPALPITDANRPKLAPPRGGLCLISYDKVLLRKGEGEYCCPRSSDQLKNLRNHIPWQPGAQLDALWLTKAECESLMPKNPEEGHTVPVPSRLVKRIGLFGLTVRSAWQEFYHWQPDSMHRGELKLTVTSVSPDAVEMRLHGSYLLSAIKKNWRPEGSGKPGRDVEDRYDARLEGKLVYDPAKKRFTRWDMVVLGDYVGFSQAHIWAGAKRPQDSGLATEPAPIVMSFEIDNWNYEAGPEYRRTVPFLFWWFRSRTDKGYDHYFNPDKWRADWVKKMK